eukprot:gene10435-biopygen13844
MCTRPRVEGVERWLAETGLSGGMGGMIGGAMDAMGGMFGRRRAAPFRGAVSNESSAKGEMWCAVLCCVVLWLRCAALCCAVLCSAA